MAEIPQELQPDLPATPLSLLALSETFDRYGYHKLARHLRAAADQLSAHPHRDVDAVLTAARYEQDVGGSRYGVTFKGTDSAVHDVRLGVQYALVPMHGQREAEATMPLALDIAEDEQIPGARGTW